MQTRFFSLFLILFLIPAVPSHARGSVNDSRPILYIYLAGPEVFLPEPIAAGEQKKALIQELNKSNDWPFELVGLYPMDNEIENFALNFETGIKIYDANIELMDKAHYVAANMVRFRGPSMDVGTAFEMGYMRGLNKPVFAYYDAAPFYGASEPIGMYVEKVAKHYPIDPEHSDKDIHGQTIESFEMADNLMMVGSLGSDDHKIETSFKDVVLSIAEHALKASQNTAIQAVQP